MFIGFILKLPIYGAPPDTLCFEDAVYWEVNYLLYKLLEKFKKIKLN